MFDRLATPLGRRLLFSPLYFSEAALIGFIWWAMPTRLRDAGVAVFLVGVVWSSLTVLLLTHWRKSLVADQAVSLATSLMQLGTSAALAAGQRRTWLALLFALVGGAAYEGLGVIAGPLLIDHGFTSENVGYLYASPFLVCTIVGSLLGGRLADRWSHRRAIFASLVWIVAAAMGSSFALGWGPLATPSEMTHTVTTQPFALISLLVALYLGIGMYTASSYALFMDLTTPGIAATQFSACMGATNGCESWSSLAIGRAVESHGYASAIRMMCLPSILALPLLLWMRPTNDTEQPDNLPIEQ